MEDIHKQINMKLAEEVLAEVKNASPLFLENLVLHLLRKMGYGQKVKAAGKRVGRTGDGI
jgi:restriction system protein